MHVQQITLSRNESIKQMKKIIVLLTIFSFTKLLAQQAPQYSQFLSNGLTINPAYAGSKEILNLNALYRAQWANIEGFPSTQTIGIDGPAFNNVGLGFHVVNDNAGAQHQLAFFGSYAYRLKISETRRLSFGVAAGASQFSVNSSKLIADVANDPLLLSSTESRLVPDAKAGIYYLTDKFYAGFSASDLLADLGTESSILLIQQQRHYFFTTGFLTTLNDKLELKPSFLLKENFRTPTNVDIHAFVLYNEKIGIGASYRTGVRLFSNALKDKSLQLNDAVVLMTEFYVKNSFRVGYAYDITTTALRGSSSHEISLSYYFTKKQDVKKATSSYF